MLTSRSIVGGRVVDVPTGGLDHRIERQLLPRAPSADLRRGRAMIRDSCLELGLPCLERSLPVAVADVVRSVHRVGIRRADPFDCPAAAALRRA